jgi:hypothetical protein
MDKVREGLAKIQSYEASDDDKRGIRNNLYIPIKL